MAQLIVPQGADISELPNDPTFPMTCVIESSYVINGHGVSNDVKFLRVIREFDFCRNIQFEWHDYFIISRPHGLLPNVFENSWI